MAFTAIHRSDSLAGSDRALAHVRAHQPTDRVSVSISSGARRDLRATAELLRRQASAAGCHVALAQTGHLAARFMDAIIWGTAGDVEAFLVALRPALTDAAGRRTRHRVDAIVAA